MRSSQVACTIGVCTIVAVAVGWVTIPNPVEASPTCRTLNEARKIWPTKHLWWHTRAHCWDDNPGKRAEHSAHKPKVPLPKPKRIPEPPARAEGPATSIIMPAIVLRDSAEDQALMLRAEAINHWPLLLDIDEVTSDSPDTQDYCCWPPLEELSFESRWQEVPVAWLMQNEENLR